MGRAPGLCVLRRDRRATPLDKLRAVALASTSRGVGTHRPDTSLPQMPAYSPYRQTPEWPHPPVPAAPTLTHDGRCSACHGVPTSICQGEVQVCRGCLAVLWHLRRPAATPKHRPPAEPPSAGRGAPKPRVPDAELVVPVPSARQRAIDAVVRSPEKSDRRIAAETGLDRATIAKARGQLDEYQPVDMPRAETPQSSDPEPPPEPAPRDEKGRFIRPGDAASEPPVSDAPVPD